MSNNSSNNTGLGICGVLFIVFLVLKLAAIGQVAHWSWWWVFAPLWMPIGLVIGIWLVIALLAGCAALIGMIGEWSTRRARMRSMMGDD